MITEEEYNKLLESFTQLRSELREFKIVISNNVELQINTNKMHDKEIKKLKKKIKKLQSIPDTQEEQSFMGFKN